MGSLMFVRALNTQLQTALPGLALNTKVHRTGNRALQGTLGLGLGTCVVLQHWEPLKVLNQLHLQLFVKTQKETYNSHIVFLPQR